MISSFLIKNKKNSNKTKTKRKHLLHQSKMWLLYCTVVINKYRYAIDNTPRMIINHHETIILTSLVFRDSNWQAKQCSDTRIIAWASEDFNFNNTLEDHIIRQRQAIKLCFISISILSIFLYQKLLSNICLIILFA